MYLPRKTFLEILVDSRNSQMHNHMLNYFDRDICSHTWNHTYPVGRLQQSQFKEIRKDKKQQQQQQQQSQYWAICTINLRHS